MNNKNYKRAKTFTLIPILILFLTLICLAFSSILAVPTSKGLIYTIFMIAGLVSIFLMPLPCLVMSIVGTVFASKAIKEGETKARKFLVLGIIEIVLFVIAVFLAAVMFIVGQGV